MKQSDWKKWFFWFTFAVAAIVVYKTIDSVYAIFMEIGNLLELLMPFILAIIIAYMLYIPAKGIEETFCRSKIKLLQKHARGLSVFAIYFIICIILFIIINFIIPAISNSITDLANNLPNYYISAIDFLEKVPEDSLIHKLNLASIVKNLEEINLTEEMIHWFSFENINQYLKGIMGATGIIFDAFVTLIVSIYLLLERSDIKNFIKNFSQAVFNKKSNETLAKYYNRTNKIFYSFVTSQIIDAFIVGIITAIAMSLMKVKYAILLGFLIGLFNIIPYFGAIVAVLISVIITIFTGGFAQAIWLAIVVIILQQVDANIINPKILGTSLELSPILIIFSVTIGGAYFGVLGMFLGVPVMALIKILIGDFVESRNRIN